MDTSNSKKIMEMTQIGYEAIASPFNDTRNRVWDDFTFFSRYVKAGDRVLDVGCGNGRLYDFLKEREISYVGIDSCEGLIAHARSKYPEARFISGSMTDLSKITGETGERFDTLFVIAAFHHLASEDLRLDVLRQMHDLLRPGGKVLMLNWNFWRPNFKEKTLWKYALQKWNTSEKVWRERFSISKSSLSYREIITTWKSGNTNAYLYYHSFTISELSCLAKKASFQVDDMRYVRRGARAHWWDGYNILSVLTRQ